MTMKDDMVPRETPPLGEKGPILEIDIDQLEDRLSRMSDKDRKKLLDMLKDHDVMLRTKND